MQPQFSAIKLVKQSYRDFFARTKTNRRKYAIKRFGDFYKDIALILREWVNTDENLTY